MPMRIRPATHQDTEAVRALYETLTAEMAALQPEYFAPGAVEEAFLLDRIADERTDLLVAEENGVPQGFALVEHVTMNLTLFRRKNYAQLVDLMVAPHSRGKGVGAALVQAAKDWGSARGLAYLQLNVLAENERAIRLYEKLGFKTRAHTMKCELE